MQRAKLHVRELNPGHPRDRQVYYTNHYTNENLGRKYTHTDSNKHTHAMRDHTRYDHYITPATTNSSRRRCHQITSLPEIHCLEHWYYVLRSDLAADPRPFMKSTSSTAKAGVTIDAALSHVSSFLERYFPQKANPGIESTSRHTTLDRRNSIQGTASSTTWFMMHNSLVANVKLYV